MEKGISLADTPVIGVVEEKIGTRGQHSEPLSQIFQRAKICRDTPFLYMRPTETVQVF